MLHKAQLTVTILSKVVKLLVFDITKVTGCVELRILYFFLMFQITRST